MAGKETLTLEKYKDLIKDHLSFYIKDKESLDEYINSDESMNEIKSRYKADINKYTSGEITYKVLTEGCVNSVAYCLFLGY